MASGDAGASARYRQHDPLKRQEQQVERQHSQQPPTLAAAAAASFRASVSVRRYCPETDHSDVVHICRNVYGGTDDLPDTINASAAQSGTHILVATTGSGSVGGSGGAGSVDALLCCQQRRDVLWLWGARTREEKRGCGLAELLLGEAEVLSGSLPGVTALLSITVAQNTTMRRLFARRGFREQCQVVTWPATEAAHAAHQQLLQLQQQRWSEGSQQAAHGLLAVLPQAAAVVDSPAARQLLPLWRRCTSVEGLQAALQLLRQHRTREAAQQAAQQAASTSSAAAAETAAAGAVNAGSHAFSWLPAQYDLEPADSSRLCQLMQEGRVWCLEAPPGSGHQQQGGQRQGQGQGHIPTAVLVLYGPGFRGMHHAGVVAGSQAALESAVLQAAAEDPLCCRLYADCCGRFDHPRLWESVPGERYDILPFYRPAAAMLSTQ